MSMEFSIESIKRKLLIKYPFFGSVLANVDYKENFDIRTAGTDGKTIHYNPNFLSTLNKGKQTFVIAHEICHIAFNHILRSEGKDAETWNIAADAVINAFLKKDGLEMVEGGVDIEDAINYDVEQLYEKLLNDKKQNQNSQSGSGEQDQTQDQNSQSNSGGQDQTQEQNSQSDSGEQDQTQEQNSQNGSGGQDQTQEQNSQSDSGEQDHTQEQNSQSGSGGQYQTQEQNSQNGSGGQDQTQEQNSQSGSGKQDQTQEQNSQSGSEEQDQTQDQNSQSGSGGQDQTQEQNSREKLESNDVGHDTHSMWEEAIRKHKESSKKNKEDKSKKDENNQSNQNKEDKSKKSNKNEASTKKSIDDNKTKEIEKKQRELQKLGERESYNRNLEERRKELEKLKKELTQQIISRPGSGTSQVTITLTDIGRSKPLIDWRYVLRETIKYDVDWSYKNATIEDGVIRANLEEQPLPETEIVLDTSGSIDDTLLKNFLRECKNILPHSKLKVGCFDDIFYGFHEIRTEEDIENMEFVGRGGTNFNAAVEAFTRRVDNKIIFTDGEGYEPEKPLDAIWIIYGDEDIKPKGGKVIRISEEQLSELSSRHMSMSLKMKQNK